MRRRLDTTTDDPHISSRRVGIVGAGVMGAGIAQVALEVGDAVAMHDRDSAALERARERVADGLRRRAHRVRPDDGSRETWVAAHLARLQASPTIRDLGASGPDLVIEAVVEHLATKRAVFAALEHVVAADTILATNTSALRVTDIAARAARPERVLGLHCFNPVPLMALVEVIATEQSDPAVVDRAVAIVTAWGKTPVRSTDTPGFIVNRVNRPFTIEALRLLESGAADVPTIDAAMRSAGFPMGPFELMDLAGLDVNLAAARGVWEGLGRPDRLRPSPIQERLVAAGRLGRKTGEGFYRYDEAGARGEPAATFASHDVGGVDGDAIVARITDAIHAEVGRAVADGVASRDDIERALRLGAGHPLRSSA